MSFEIHREPLYRKYRAPYYSWACLYTIVLGFLMIFIPFIISYNSGSFWLKEKVVYEQPDVVYRYKAMFQLFGSQPEKPLSLFYSSSNKLNSLFQEHVRMSVLRSAVLDDNKDGMMDRLELGLQVPVYSYENITRISGMVYHGVTLKNNVRYLFDSVSYFNYESGQPLGNVLIDGDIMVRQTGALSTRAGFRNMYGGDALFDIAGNTSAVDVSFNSLLERVGGRNLTTNFVETHAYGTPALYTSTADVEFPKLFNATITMRVPLQPLLVQPSVSETLKSAWVQYASFLIIIGFLFSRLSSFIFHHRLIYAESTVDVVHEKLD